MTISRDARWGFRERVVDGVRVLETPDLLPGLGRSGWDPWDTGARVLHLAGAGTWDVVHAWDCRPVVILPALYARLLGRTNRLFIDWCDWWGRGGTQSERRQPWLKLIDPLETYFEEAFRTDADGTTVISGPLRDRAIGLGVPPHSIHLLRQGCDEVAPLTESRGPARLRLGLTDRDKIVISVGVLLPADAEILFAALPELFARRPDCRFFLIGKHGARVPDTIRAYPQFTETGFIADSVLADFVSACDCLLTPLADTIASRARWPSKINPVLAAGRTVVVSKVGDLPHLLDREGAAVVANCDPQSLVEQTLAVLGDDERRQACEDRARAVARDLLAWPLLAAQLEQFYMRPPGSQHEHVAERQT